MYDALIEIIKQRKTKVIGIHDLERAASLPKDYLDDDSLAELCRQLREEHVIAYVQGKGLFKHIRITE